MIVAAPVLFLFDLVMTSLAGQVASVVGLTVIPGALAYRKHQLKNQQELGLNPDQQVHLLIERARKEGGLDLSFLEAKKKHPSERFCLIELPEEKLTPACKYLAGDYLITTDERFELIHLILFEQLGAQEGTGEKMYAGGVRASDLIMHRDDYHHLVAKVLLLRDHYTPLRVEDPTIMEKVLQQDILPQLEAQESA